MSEENRKVNANDIISGGGGESQQSSSMEDGKLPGGIHPVVAERLAREQSQQSFDQTPPPPDVPNTTLPQPPSGDYVTRDEMKKFVDELNVQLAEISRWLNAAVTDIATMKNAVMTVQQQQSQLRSQMRGGTQF